MGASAHAQEGVRVHGTVIDSTRMRPLVAARVYAIPVATGGRLQALTDSAGQYVFETLPLGDYVLDVRHARRDSLRVEVPLVAVSLRERGSLRADLGLPSVRTLVTTLCGTEVEREGTGLVIGTVRNAVEQAPAPNATVSARWHSITVARRRVQRDSGSTVALASQTGKYLFCGVPVGAGLRLQGRLGADVSGAIDVAMPEERLLIRDFTVGPQRTRLLVVRDGVGDTATVEVPGGISRLVGEVRTVDGAPVAGARVRLASGSDLGITSSRGAFVLDSLPPGTQVLDVRGLGYAPHSEVVDLPAAGEQRVNVTMAKVVPRLGTMRVVASRIAGSEGYARFEQRRLAGRGWFLGAEEIERVVAVAPSDLLYTAPGVYLATLAPTAGIVVRNGAGGKCNAAIVVDGFLFRGDGLDLQAMASPDRLIGVEVYAGGRRVPDELWFAFNPMKYCGVVAFWTGERRKS